MEKYDHQAVEQKWRAKWEQSHIDETDIALSGKGKGRKPFYNLMMFPYPSAEGLHVGNMYAFTGSDILGRFKRMQGYEVFEPIGLDGFGIHSENYALKVGRHPMDHAAITEKNFYTQLHRIGAMFDWSRTVETYQTDYYRYTQWLFVQMFKHGLAYRGKAQVNWCPSCKTVLADEQIIPARHATQGVAGGDGICERCGSTVIKKSLEQWFFRITAYAEKLLGNIPKLNWSQKVLTAQKNWIGKTVGLSIDFSVEGIKKPITAWTKYWETIYGVTFLVISPQHKVLDELNVPESNRKNGFFTGAYAVNPANGNRVPVWIADYVMAEVGTGAVMGVPAHDQRDFDFAKKYNIPILQVVRYKDAEIDSKVSKNEMAHEGEGVLINSGKFNGMDAWGEGKKKMAEWMIEKGSASWRTTYHLRDWLISRQRYWGPPIPMIYCSSCAKAGESWFTSKEAEKYIDDIGGWPACQRLSAAMAGRQPVPEKDLPVVLPRIDDYKPGDDGIAPLAKHKEFYETVCPKCGGKAVRETDVSDTFLDSSWYFLRYPSVPRTAQVGNENFDQAGQNFIPSPQEGLPWDPAITKKWLPVSMYTGGAEHSVLHLMYSRFVWMCLRDWGYIDFSAQGGSRSAGEEPFPNFFAHGLIIKDGAKMSKSKGNVVNPDEYIDRYGADALRLYLMFTGPFSQGGDFRDSAMEGTYRWVGRVWRMAQASLGRFPELKHLQFRESSVDRALHKLVKKVGEDIEARRYNTAIAAMMEFTNLVASKSSPAKQDQAPPDTLSIESLKTFLLILAPFAPYLTEELWQQLKPSVVSHQSSDQLRSIHLESWPSYDPSKIVEDKVEIVIQVNGKVRDKIVVDRQTASEKEKLVALAKKSERVLKFLEDKVVSKIIVIPERLVNLVI